MTRNSQQPANPPICRECWHYSDSAECRHPANLDGVDLIRGGQRVKWLALELRSDTGHCGPDGDWFKPLPWYSLRRLFL